MTKEEHLNKILEADVAYYDNDEPIMSDAEYDALRKSYEDKYGALDYVPGNVKPTMQSFKHTHNINSLDKIKFFETEKLKKTITKLLPIVVEPKYDGLTVVAYPDGKFVTRGNGTEGEILQRFPEQYLDNSSEYAIRGEAYITHSDFVIINHMQEERGLPKFANTRNACAGLLRRLEDNPYLNYIRFVAYDVLGFDGTEFEKIKYIRKHTSFDISPCYPYESNVDNIIKEIEKIYDELKSSDTPVDGVVIKSNIKDSLKIFGSTRHHPNNAFAYKAEEETKVTILRSVDWQVGSEGLTPVANFDTVELDGTEVSKASLANLQIFKEFNFHEGDEILVRKSNQIIPQILKKVSYSDGKRFKIPTHCPSCNNELLITKRADGCEDLICDNPNCNAKLANRIIYMFSKPCLNANGISTQTVSKFINKGFVESPFDMFDLTEEDILSIEGFKEKSAKNIYDSIQKSRKNKTLATFIASIGCIGIGSEVGKLLSQKFKTYDTILNVLKSNNKTAIFHIKGIGVTTMDKLFSQSFIADMERMRQYIEPISDDVIVVDNAKTFVITGKLSHPRKFYVDLIESKGHKVIDSISKTTSYLVLNDKTSTSSKTKAAKKNNIPIISEEDLITMLQ